MRDDWDQKSLVELCSMIKRGISPKYSDVDGVEVINQRCIRDYSVTFENSRLHDVELKNIPGDRYLSSYDIVVNSTGVGTLGRVAQLNEISKDLTVDSHVTIVRAIPESIDSKYLGHALKAKQREIESLAEGSTGQTELSRHRLGEILINFPKNKQEQKAIAHILGTLDDKIELNRQMNETLEEMAQALFKSWFVDFDPVLDKALAAGHEIPEPLQVRAKKRKLVPDAKKLIHTNPELVKAFPDRFTFNAELGWIPEGWEMKELIEIASINSENWKTSNLPSKIKYLDLSNVKEGQILQVTDYSSSDAPSRARRILRTDDIIFGTVRPGNRSFKYIHKEGYTGSTGFAVLRPKVQCFRSFTYLYVTSKTTVDYLSHSADGAAYPAINSSKIGEMSVPVAKIDIMESFDSLAFPLLSKQHHNNLDSELLSKLRDTLLPKLISGELRVPEAEQLIESHG
jgi:type I restriction enzyme S subunit